MANLMEMLNSADKRAAVIHDCVQLLDEEVASKSGLSGVAIKTGYKVLKGFKPGFVPKVVEELLPEFTQALDPVYAEAQQKKAPTEEYFNEHKSRVADALLAITDRKAEHAKIALLKSTYLKLRPTAKKHVEAAVPKLGQLVRKHASA